MSFGKSRIVTFILAGAILLSLLSGAGKTAAQDAYVKTFDLPTKPSADGAYAGVDPSNQTIIYWHQQTGNNGKALEKLVDTFNKSNPWKIKVQPILKGNTGVIFQAMLAALQTKDLPNLLAAYQNEAATYQNVNALVDLNDFVNDKTYGFGKAGMDDFFSAYLAQDVNPQYNNQRLGIAVFRSLEVMYYNKDALKALGYDAPPKSWQEFEEIGCKYKDSGAGRLGYEVRTDASGVAAAAFAQGGDVYDPKTNKFTLDTAEVQVYPQVMQDMMQKGCAGLPAAAFADQNDFAAQKVLFYTGTSAGFTFVRDAINKTGKPFDWEIAAIPYKDKPVGNVYGASVSVVNTAKEKNLAAWLYLRWFTEPEQQAVWAQASNYYPVRQSTAAGMADYFAKNPEYKTGFDLLGSIKAEPPLIAWNPVRLKITASLNDVLDGKPVDETFAKLNDDANAALDANKPGAALPTPNPTATPKPATPEATAAK